MNLTLYFCTRRTLPTNYWTEPQGHVVAITDAEGNITSASYNALGQRTQSKDPDQGTWAFTYDAFGELLTQTDARLAVSSIVARDALGRTTQRQTVPPASVPGGMASDTTFDQWSYDLTTSLLTSVVRRRGTNSASPSSNPLVWQKTYTYEGATFRPSTTTTTITEGSTPQSNLFSQTVYDTSGRVLTRQYPSGLIVQNRYTAYGQLDALSNAGTGYVYWVSLGQNQWQHTVSEQFPGVISGTYADYGSTGQAQALAWTGTTADQMTYTYDSFGNLTKQTRAAPYSNNEAYTYDAVQRLTQGSRATGNIVSYGYSDSGNLTSKTDFGSYSYGAINSRTSGCGPHAVFAVGSTSYTCDTNGNVIGGSTLTTTFDVNNQARTASRIGNGSITWAYNALGARDYESDGTERYFVGDEFRIEGANKRHELGPVTVTRNGSTDTIAVALRDRLGSTLNIIDNGGAPVARQYDAFGKPRNGDMTDRAPATLALQPPTIFGFSDHEHDDSVLLIHMKGRVYDYQLGRFLGVDPIIGNAASSQALNPYSYIGNNPLSGIDATGYDCQVDIKGEVASACLKSNDGVNKVTDVNGHTIMTAIVMSKGDHIEFSSSSSNGASFGATFTGRSGDITRLLTSPTPDVSAINEHSNGALEGVTGAYAQGNDKSPAHVTDVMAQQALAQGRADAEAHWQWTRAHQGLEGMPILGVEAVGQAMHGAYNEVKQTGGVSTSTIISAAAIGLAGALHLPGAARGVAEDALEDSALVCRGGLCTADYFAKGTGVTFDAAGNLQNVSVQSATGKTVQELTTTLKNSKVGVTTVGDIRRAGGDVVPTGREGNPYHCTMCGITPQKAEELFTPVVPNPNQ